MVELRHQIVEIQESIMKITQSIQNGIQLMSALIFIFALNVVVLADKKSDEHSAKHKSHETVEVYIIEPSDGATVPTSFTVKFGLKGMNVAPAGSDMANSGHHHLLIDSDKLPKKDIPMGSNVKHFGKGQTETALTLEKGVHTLQLIIGDKFHIPMADMVISEKISITVE